MEFGLCVSISFFLQINELSNVPVPVMLMPDDFKAYSKIKVDRDKVTFQRLSLSIEKELALVARGHHRWINTASC